MKFDDANDLVPPLYTIFREILLASVSQSDYTLEVKPLDWILGRDLWDRGYHRYKGNGGRCCLLRRRRSLSSLGENKKSR